VATSHALASTLILLAMSIVTLCLWPSRLGQAQVYSPDQEIRIRDLPSLTAKSRSASDVLATSVEILFRDGKVCCGKNSALEDSVQAADPKSLKDIANKLQGRHLLSDGRPIMITAEYLAPASVNVSQLMNTLIEKHPLLMEWNSHLYVAYGVIFDQTLDQDGGIMNAIHKIFLLDTRFSEEDKRREISFDRLTDDWGKVQGLVMLKAAAQ
jgi:hypothetical protein